MFRKKSSKPTATAKPTFGSIEHRKLAGTLHYGLVPWQVFYTHEDAEACAKRVRLADRNKEHPRSLCVCEINPDIGEELAGYGVFFLANAKAATPEA